MIGHHLFAVLIPAHAATATVVQYLRPLLDYLRGPGTVDEYRFGGQFTGAWDPDYNPTLDPGNWRPCDTCDGTPPGCLHCGDAVPSSRRAR